MTEGRVNPRLRVLELPMQHSGPYSDTPFVFVIDRAGTREEPMPENLGEAVKSLGAVGAIVFDTEIDLE
ncbi:MAG: hypothetical protein ACTIJ6_05400 [Leucobacter sp.]